MLARMHHPLSYVMMHCDICYAYVSGERQAESRIKFMRR
jgi:hypothetical protein